MLHKSIMTNLRIHSKYNKDVTFSNKAAYKHKQHLQLETLFLLISRNQVSLLSRVYIYQIGQGIQKSPVLINSHLLKSISRTRRVHIKR